jgi:hypothetical protein
VESLENGGRECVVEIDLCSLEGFSLDLNLFGSVLRACKFLKVVCC